APGFRRSASEDARERACGSIRATILRSSTLNQLHTEPAGEILHILPGHAARARPARCRPLERFALQFFAAQRNPVVADIARDKGEVFVLAAAVEAEPESEAIRQRPLLLNRLARIDGGRALVLHHVARHQVTPVRRGIEHDIVGTAFDAPLKYRLE